jgi:hypothetical protein
MTENNEYEKRNRTSSNVEDEDEDVKELREVLTAISEFLEGLKKPVQDILTLIMGQLSGEKLGKEVADFYRNLKESGMDEEMVKEMTQQYFQRRLESANIVKILQEVFSKYSNKDIIKGVRKGKIGSIFTHHPEEGEGGSNEEG